MSLIPQDRSKLSPMMQQYLSMKDEHRDQILMFRLGDFYEMFFDDAVTASRELELTLTGRDCGLPDRAPMCGVPYHSVDNYIARLVKKGYKVAICEQMENPALAKGMVKRDIVRVVTPGTLMEANMLEEGSNNYICSLCPSGDRCGLAFADISTGSVLVTEVSGEMAVINELENTLRTRSFMPRNCRTCAQWSAFSRIVCAVQHRRVTAMLTPRKRQKNWLPSSLVWIRYPACRIHRWLCVRWAV